MRRQIKSIAHLHAKQALLNILVYLQLAFIGVLALGSKFYRLLAALDLAVCESFVES